jgi:hypothetical protein
MTQKGLWALIDRYGDVVLKPVDSGRGFGVIRISTIASNSYEIHIENTRTTIKGNQQMKDFIKEKIGRRGYIVQHRIPLATVNGRPFDMRVVVQRRDQSDDWVVTGMVAKVAGYGYIVTNIRRSNGMVLPILSAIRQSSLKNHSRKSLLTRITKVALLSADKLSNSILYANQRIFGFDMGLDQNGRVWVIEANLNPMLSHFSKLKDNSMYRRIMDYKKNSYRSSGISGRV